MKSFATALLVMVSMTACGKSAQEPSAEQSLHANFLNAYKPLESCLNERLGGINNEKAASAIVSANKLPELNEAAIQLLPSDNPKLLIALKESGAEKKAFALLDALVGYREARIKQKIDFDSYGLLREVVPAIVLSNVNSVGCPQPKYLEYWAREIERNDLYLNLAMESKQFTDCVYGDAGKPSSDWPSIIVEANKLNELEALAVRILGKNNPQLVSAIALEDPIVKASSLIYLLGQFAATDSLPNQSYEVSIRHVLGMSGIKLIYAQAKKQDCALPNPSWHTMAESYLIEHPVTANPSPFTTNNKVDKP